MNETKSIQAPSAPIGAQSVLELGHLFGVGLITAERMRQISAEGWEPDHDDTHQNSELLRAALAYLLVAAGWPESHVQAQYWPWEASYFKPADLVRNLVKAGALIAAEIDRLNRQSSAS